MNAIGYLRLSMRDQSRYSLEYQESSINEYCKRNNIELLAVFKDNGQSSYNFDRQNYIALESFIKKHKGGVNYLIVMDHDRFSRNLPEALMKIKSLENRFKIKVVATNESPDLDTNDPDVFLNRAFKYLMTNNELLRIRQRTSRGIRTALEGGRFVNRAPYGYYNQKAEGRKGVILVNEEEVLIIRKVFFDFLLGHPITQIHKNVKSLGYPGISRSAIRRL
jgi:site-specific DNA recombinase